MKRLKALALEFARAISARPVARLHTGGNTYGDSARLVDIRGDRPFAVYVANRDGFRTLALDLDAKKGDPNGDENASVALLSECGIASVLVASGAAGGRHVEATFQRPIPAAAVKVIREEFRRRFASLDPGSLLPSQAIRPPLAPHRHGGRSEILNSTVETALHTLKVGNDRNSVVALLRRLGVEPWWAEYLAGTSTDARTAITMLSGPMRELLIEGQKRRGDTSRSGLQHSVMVACRNAELGFADVTALLQGPKHVAGARLRHDIDKKGEEYAIRRAWQEWERVCTYVAEHPAVANPTEARLILAEISDVADSHRWKGTTGNTDLAALQTILAIALKVGNLSITASYRQIAELACLGGPNTIQRSVRRLETAGWFTVMSRGTGSKATQFRFQNPTHHSIGGDIKNLNIGRCVINVAIPAIVQREHQHDVFRRGGIGKNAWIIHSFLDFVVPRSVRDLRDESGKPDSSVRLALRRLETCGLAVATDDRPQQWRRVDKKLDDVAIELGVAGATQRQHAKHQIERDLYRHTIDNARLRVDPETGEIRFVYRTRAESPCLERQV